MKKRMYVLLILLLVSSLLVGSWGAYLKYERFCALDIETQESIFALPFVLMADPQLQYTVKNRTEQLMNPTEPTVPVETQVPTETLPPETVPPVTVVTIPPTTEPVETGPVYVPVDESWFDAALFIGESRTAGLHSMGRLGNAEYFSASSLSVLGVLDMR